jgi:hypothetical protein
MYIYYNISPIFLEWEMFKTKFVETIKTHILYSTIFFHASHALYEKMLENMAESGKSQMAI